MKKSLLFCAGLAVGLGLPPYVRLFQTLADAGELELLALFYVGPAALVLLFAGSALICSAACAFGAVCREIKTRLTWK